MTYQAIEETVATVVPAIHIAIMKLYTFTIFAFVIGLSSAVFIPSEDCSLLPILILG